MQEARVNISPLELLAQAALAATVLLICEVVGNGQLVLRCDNRSACDVILTRRPKSPALRVALKFAEVAERVCCIRIRLENIPTYENLVADALSRDAAKAAEQLARVMFESFEWFDVETELPIIKDETEQMYNLYDFSKVSEREVTGALLAADLELADGEAPRLSHRQKAKLAKRLASSALV